MGYNFKIKNIFVHFGNGRTSSLFYIEGQRVIDGSIERTWYLMFKPSFKLAIKEWIWFERPFL